MKFLMIVLAVHFIAEMIGNRGKNKTQDEGGEGVKHILHPAEDELRP